MAKWANRPARRPGDSVALRRAGSPRLLIAGIRDFGLRKSASSDLARDFEIGHYSLGLSDCYRQNVEYGRASRWRRLWFPNAVAIERNVRISSRAGVRQGIARALAALTLVFVPPRAGFAQAIDVAPFVTPPPAKVVPPPPPEGLR